MSQLRTPTLLATAVAALALAAPVSATPRPDPPTAAAFEQATQALLRGGELNRAAMRGGGIGTGSPGSSAGRDLFANRRLLNLYGAPQLSATILGRLGPAAAARKAARQARPYARIGDRPVIPGLDLIAVVANSTPGSDGLYRTRQPVRLIRAYLRAARSVGGRLTLDIQPGRARVSDEVRALERWIAKPNVDVAIDPEWEVGRRGVPGRTVGKIRAREINRVSRRIQAIVDAEELPPKALVVHQFRRGSVRGRRQIRQRRDVAVTLNFDGIGSPAAKRAGYLALRSPKAFDGFSIFYSLDTRVMSPRSVLGLEPAPDFLLFQ
ncbi:MAG TPA: hypothetical protein VFH44_09295 [Solirubrobacterales bacterium]|nr:hypothetical protein [Solirubrobacterales bacterium]